MTVQVLLASRVKLAALAVLIRIDGAGQRGAVLQGQGDRADGIRGQVPGQGLPIRSQQNRPAVGAGCCPSCRWRL